MESIKVKDIIALGPCEDWRAWLLSIGVDGIPLTMESIALAEATGFGGWREFLVSEVLTATEYLAYDEAMVTAAAAAARRAYDEATAAALLAILRARP